MTLPNFLIAGAQKSGTTWLAQMLAQHPEVFIYPKEIHFFDHGPNYQKGLDWYLSHFKEAENKKAVGEKTPEYLWVHDHSGPIHLPNVQLNVHKALPKAKLILILRNPVTRSISAAKHLIRAGYVSPFRDIDDLLLRKDMEWENRAGIIEKGFYAKHICAYQKLYSRQQMLILIFEEDVAQQPEATLERVCEFLRINPSYTFVNPYQKIHETRMNLFCLALRYYFPLLKTFYGRLEGRLPKSEIRPKQSTIDALYKLYAPENEKLFELIGRRITAWEENVEDKVI
jgi:hypothetical protein